VISRGGWAAAIQRALRVLPVARPQAATDPNDWHTGTEGMTCRHRLATQKSRAKAAAERMWVAPLFTLYPPQQGFVEPLSRLVLPLHAWQAARRCDLVCRGR